MMKKSRSNKLIPGEFIIVPDDPTPIYLWDNIAATQSSQPPTATGNYIVISRIENLIFDEINNEHIRECWVFLLGPKNYGWTYREKDLINRRSAPNVKR
jgi:hypothetical protein